MADTIEGRLREQVAYYRVRAPVYDAWGNREGAYDRGERNEGWHAEKRRLEAALDEFRPMGSVLEIAGGTGQWTERLVRHADRLTVLDAAPEALALNVKRLARASGRVRFEEADVFSWRSPERFDAVFFGFWLSHVPPERFEEFWARVADHLTPDGRVFVIDNLPSVRATDLDPELPGDDAVSVLRPAPDGQLYRVWKILWRPDELRDALANLGWHVEAYATGMYFLWAEGRRT